MADQQAWSSWLEKNHTKSPGVWLKLAKKGSETLTVSYNEALEEVLRYGWIDGQKKGFDESFWLQVPLRLGERLLGDRSSFHEMKTGQLESAE